MPNGASKNLVRLCCAAAVYRAKFNEWPGEARMPPLVVWDLAQVLDGDNFEQLATRLRLFTSAETTRVSVGGSAGIVWYDEVDFDRVQSEQQETATRWLGLEMRVDEY
jgi:hypothetical protein